MNSEFDSIVEKIVKDTESDDPNDIAEEVAQALLSLPRPEAEPLVAEAAMPRVIRHLRRLLHEDDVEEPFDVYDAAANLGIIEPVDPDIPRDMPETLTPFVDKTVRIPGVGLVRWGDVTLEQHLARVKWIETKVGGLSRAKARHQETIRYCRRYFANTLYEAIDKAND